MFVNKIIGATSNIAFRGPQHIVNSVGKTVELFGYPYTPETQTCEIEFVRVKRNDKYNIVVDKSSKQIVQLKPEGVEVDPSELLNLDEGESYAYKIRIKDKNNPSNIIWEGADTGVKIKKANDSEYIFKNSDGKHWEDVKDANGKKIYSYETSRYGDINDYEYTLVTTHGTTPMSNGAGYLAMTDSLWPGYKFKDFNDPNTGEITFDEATQKRAESSLRNFSNIMGGSIAGLIAIIPYLKENGYSMLFGLPIANGDDVTSHSYWNKNNMQIASRMGNNEDFAYLMRELYKNGIQYVFDGTFTSEGLEGIHFQYALRWAQKNPQTYYWFRMNGLKNSNLGLGVVPENAKNLSHRVVNAPFNYEKQPNGTYKKVANRKYNPNKETIFQIYDASQVSDFQKKALDNQIRVYENITSGNPMDVNTHDDTIIAYAFQINPAEYQDRIDSINSLIKSGKKVDLYSEDGTLLAGQFSNFKIDKKTEGGFVTWDANTDMVKVNYGISGYDLKNLKAIPDRAKRYHEQQMMERGAREATDMNLQSGRYWTSVVREIQTIYTAKTIGKNNNISDIKNLVEKGLLPKKGMLTEEELSNIINGEYIFRTPKGVMDKNSVTIKALMDLPLDTLKLGENTVGVLSTSYFSNRATTDETIGKTRFELLKANNPHLIGEYASVYNSVNSLYTNELKDFADKVIKKVNENSNEKLLDSSGNYTEYGEYVIENFAKDIATYALLKAFASDNFKSKIRFDGLLTYNYDEIKSNTTLKALGINASNPKEEAEKLQKIMKKGLTKLNSEDIDMVTKSILTRTEGTNTTSYRVSEAMVNKASIGAAWRLDALKDTKDQDAVRNRENDFDDTWNETIKFWRLFVQSVKKENPNAYTVAELTDIPELLRATYGAKSCPYDGNTNVNNCKFEGDMDAQTKFYNETGITSEAAYSFLFTNLLHNFSGNFENGDFSDGINHDDFKKKVDILMQTRSADYIRNLYTFIGNHDKTRTIQGLATDMKLFHSPISYTYDAEGKIDFSKESEQRQKVIQVLSGVTNSADTPIELRLNVDNIDYFRTISPKAVAQAKTLLLPIQEDLKGLATENEIRLLTQAVVDLANGNYLIDKNTKSMTRVDIPEIATLEKTIGLIADMAASYGFKLTPHARAHFIKTVLEKANSMNLEDYQVRGDFNWGAPNQEIGEKNRGYLQEILGTQNDGSNYSLYTVQLARLVRDAYIETQGSKKYANPAMDAALKDFINKFNRSYVESKTSAAEKFETRDITGNKDSFGVKPFETVMEWVINQAEFKTGRRFTNKKAIIDRVVTSITEPAIQKQAIILSYLNGLAGIPTVYAGDEYGMSGYENKTKNTYLQNRNAVLRNGVNAERYSKETNGALQRNDESLHALNEGTPYTMDVLVGGKDRDSIKRRIAEINYLTEKMDAKSREYSKLMDERRLLTKELAKVAYMMYSSNGDAVISVFSAADVNHSNRCDYYDYIAKEYGIDSDAKRKKAFADGTLYSLNPNNKYVPIQHRTELDAILLGAGIALPVGTVFLNANARDKVQYVVKDINGKLGIVRKDGKKIKMDGITAKNGVMLLKRMKNIIFRGSSYNAQYNLASNPYAAMETPPEEGKKLSLIAR